MRPALRSVLLFVLLAAACKKSGDPRNPNISGKWRLASYSRGFSGILVPVPSDSVCVLSLNNDLTYGKTRNDTVYESGTYTITRASAAYNEGEAYPALKLISPGGLAFLPLLISMDGDTLDLFENSTTGSGYRYGRVK